MLFKRLLDEGKLKTHRTSATEIADLLKIIERDINDTRLERLSPDRRFAIAYNAALQLATILLYCKGYRAVGAGHHFTVFQAMKEILGKEYNELADYFDSCRSKRNITDYDRAGEISETEVKELIDETLKFKAFVINWVKKNYSIFWAK
ncbi:MAG: SAV_6107 family HEPN domain-containing protein [candidate division WOR-3 bacterium]|nr:SAV_6107 family HEPN domain-containing protein [candidate division WOR-3 bacterium]